MSVKIKADLDDNVSGKLDKIQKELKNTGDSTKALGNTMKAVGGAMAGYFTIQGISSVIGSIKEMQDAYDGMQDAIAGAQGTTGKSRAELDALAKSLQDASDSSLSYTEALQAVSKGTQTGILGVEDMSAIVAHANVVAKQSGQETKVVIQQLTDAISAGSGEALTKLGVLEGGMDAVRGAYDKASKDGVGSFDKLTETQKKLIVTQESLKNIQELGPIYEKTGIAGADGMDDFNRALQDSYKAMIEVVGSSGFKEFVGEIAKGIQEYAIPAINMIPDAIKAVSDMFNATVGWIAQTIASVGETVGLLPEGTAEAVKETNKIVSEEREKQRAQNEALAKQQQEAEDRAIADAKRLRDEKKKQVDEAKQWEADQKAALKQVQELEQKAIEQVKTKADVQKKAWEEQQKRLDEEKSKLEIIKGLQQTAVDKTRNFLKPSSSSGSSSSPSGVSAVSNAPDMSQTAPMAPQSPSYEAQQAPARAGNGYAQSLAGYGVFNMGGESGSGFFGGGQGPQQMQGQQQEAKEAGKDFVGEMIAGLKQSDVLKGIATLNGVSVADARRGLKSGEYDESDVIEGQRKALRTQIDKAASSGQINQRQAQALYGEVKDRAQSALDAYQTSQDEGQIGGFVAGTAKKGSADTDVLGAAANNQKAVVDKQTELVNGAKESAEANGKLLETMTKQFQDQKDINDNLTQRIKDAERIIASFASSSQKSASASRGY